MKDRTDIELIEQIKNVLHSHEEPYKEGSWERFATHSLHMAPVKTGKRHFRYWIAAACILLLGATGTFILFNTNKPAQTVATHQHKPAATVNPNFTDRYNDSMLHSNTDETFAIQIPEEKIIRPEKSILREFINKVFPEKNNNLTVNNQPANNIPEKIQKQDAAPLTNLTQNQNIISTDVANNNAAPKNNIVNNNNIHQQNQPVYTPDNIYVRNNPVLEHDAGYAKKWNLAAEVASSISNNKKMNLSYGINIGYALNNKLSIHSGASFSQLNSAIDNPASSASMNGYEAYADINVDMNVFARSASTAEPTVKSSELRLAGIEIPLEMRYNFNKKLYTNIGVSAMALVENKQLNSYVTESSKPVGFAAGNKKSTSTKEIVETKVESVPGTSVVNDKFLEFFNMSIGYKQPITPKRNIRIEPFVKIPINNTGVKVPLSNAGIRLGIDL